MGEAAARMFEPLPQGSNGKRYVPQDDWQPISPVPADAPVLTEPKLGGRRPSQTWRYPDGDGRLLLYVFRWDGPNGAKEFRPWTFCEDRATGRRAWQPKGPTEPRPLYGLDRLAQRPDAPVLVVEGEKAADAGARLLPLYAVITSSGGAQAPAKADWAPLAGRAVVIWPDADEPGQRYAGAVAIAAQAAGARSVHIVSLPGGVTSGWDLADAEAEGTPAQLIASLIDGAAVPREDMGGGDTSGSSASHPDMSIVRRVTAPAPMLDLEAFGPLAPWIVSAAECKSCPPDYVALPLIGAAAGCVGAARWVSPWSGWREPTVLWTLIVGTPSASKSPGQDAVREPLAEVERQAAELFPDAERDYEEKAVFAKAAYEVWSDAVKAAVKKGQPTPPMPVSAIEPDKPLMPRIAMSDATIEAVVAVHAANPRGLVLWRDELAAWLGNVDKYGDGDRAFWLEGYGARPYTADRKKNPKPQIVDHLSISICGGVQPDRYGSLLMGGDDDGLAARFLVAWPEAIPPRRPKNRTSPAPVSRALGRLYRLPFDTHPETGKPLPKTLPIEAGALSNFQEWREAHHAASLPTSGLMASAWGKMPGQALRLALVLELLWWAAGPDHGPEPVEVSADALGWALDLVEGYFKPMLARVLGEAALPQADRDAAVLAREIQARKAIRINRREVRRDWRLAGLRDSARLAGAIAVLEEARWLTPIGGRDGENKGRERADFAVNPRVHEVSP